MSAAAHLMPLAIAVPIIVACAMVAVGPYLPRGVADVVAVVTAASVAGMAAALLSATGGGRVVARSGG